MFEKDNADFRSIIVQFLCVKKFRTHTHTHNCTSEKLTSANACHAYLWSWRNLSFHIIKCFDSKMEKMALSWTTNVGLCKPNYKMLDSARQHDWFYEENDDDIYLPTYYYYYVQSCGEDTRWQIKKINNYFHLKWKTDFAIFVAIFGPWSPKNLWYYRVMCLVRTWFRI